MSDELVERLERAITAATTGDDPAAVIGALQLCVARAWLRSHGVDPEEAGPGLVALLAVRGAAAGRNNLASSGGAKPFKTD